MFTVVLLERNVMNVYGSVNDTDVDTNVNELNEEASAVKRNMHQAEE